MPIPRYGVLRGQPVEKQDATGKSPHYQVQLSAAKRQYRVAVNVRSQQKPVDVLYFVDQDFRHELLSPLLKVAQGFTPIASQPGGLALDFVRGRLFDTTRMRPLPFAVQESDNDLHQLLDGVAQRAIATNDAEVFAFGQGFPGPDQTPRKDSVFGFNPGAGVHDVHMNQGSSSRFRGEDAAWQDGALFVHLPKANRWVAVFLAFQSQSFQTGDDGHAATSSRSGASGRRARGAAPMAPVGESLAAAAIRTALPSGRVAPVQGIPLDGLEWPPTRPLRAYAFDPSRGRLLGNEMAIEVRRVELAPGPVVQWGEYGDRVAVVDYDGASGCYYQPVDLDHPRILMSGGLAPSESDPRFHQQMVYAVASDTVEHFEAALGRRIHWRRAERNAQTPRGWKADDITTLHLYPHAFRSPNAFYSPDAHGILFGYFRADNSNPGRNLPGQPVFTCLSHDIVVHETTHAILDGIRGYFIEQTNVDVPAFHEAFADLTALFRHFSHQEVLQDTMQRTGGRLFDYQLKSDATTDAGAAPRRHEGDADVLISARIRARNPLIELAEQFGEASGLRRGLRSALGTPPSPEPLARLSEPHARGSILVAAVFDAFFSTYVARTSDLFRIFRAGGGSATPVDLPGPLANQLCAEATRTADQFFCLCARALDYCPPVDITFGDFLRAVITAHWDHDEADADGLRYTWMQAFRLRGIRPTDARFFSEASLRWPTGAELDLPPLDDLDFGDPSALTNAQKASIAPALRRYASRQDVLVRLGLNPAKPIDVPSFHPVFRVQRDGSLRTEMVVELVQTTQVGTSGASFPFRAGATLILQHTRDRQGGGHATVRYAIAKPGAGPHGKRRLGEQTAFAERGNLSDSSGGNPLRIDFAMVHGGM